MILRPIIAVRLYKNNEVVLDTTSTLKTRVSANLLGLVRSKRKFDYGLCRVTYHRRKNLYNEFAFKTFDEFQKQLSECTEKPLLDFIAEGAW